MEDLDVNLALWGMFMNITLRAAVHLGKDSDTNLRFVKNLSVENNGTAFQGNKKADQWSDRNHWHKPDQFPRIKVGTDKFIAQSSLSMCHCQGLCLLWLCALLGKNGRESCWILKEANSMVFGHRLFQRIESNWWTTHGIRVEDLPRIHECGNPHSDSTDGKITVWTRELHRQDHLHVNVQRHCMGCKKEMMKYVHIIQRQLKSMQEDFLAVIGLSWGLDPKRSGTELTIAKQNQTRRISQDPVIRYSVVPVPWREDD